MTERGAVFLERQSYRRRRLTDSIRMLPVIGALLWLVPLLWSRGTEETPDRVMSTADAMIYTFGVWLLLIVLAFALSWRIRGAEGGGATDGSHRRR